MPDPRPAQIPVAVIGAGPYGLAVAAHLRELRVGFRIFGDPMESWCGRMPVGMYLKSPPIASSIADPGDRYALATFRAAEGRPQTGDLHPVSLEEFVRYGHWFQEHCVPELERSRVKLVEPGPQGFRLTLDTGEVVDGRTVVVATGLGAFGHVPADLACLTGSGLVSHSADHADLSVFRGRRVAVVGAGQSALESAVLLHEAGGEPTLVARAPEVLFGGPPAADRSTDRPLPVRLAKPGSPLGPGWSLYACTRIPGAFPALPAATRIRVVKQVLGPSGAWWLRDRFEDRFPVLTGHHVTRAERTDGHVALTLDGPEGRTTLDFDHVIAATGYRVDLHRLDLLAPLLPSVQTLAGSPRLSHDFESSARGLYFTGLAAALTFGPVLRFVYGTGFSARRISAAVARTAAGTG
ncbi:NAD(P)-binding domain-containing protein [Kitasatospora sp. NPDC059571]|uniref:NAD(P)-binding domain-containing protein n=1 Tax=Kitasatospora sp. NPDC059571 TaxID=3346871 RepID=UPI0036D0398B